MVACRMIMDVDTGVDDALALALAVRHPDIHLEGVLTVAEPGELTLVCTGPCTNLALAVQRAPSIVQAVREVVVMGGAVRPPGNATPVAEFNIYADPEAAAIVFGQAWRATLVGLDVTMQVTLTRADRDALVGNATPEAALVREVTRHLFDVRNVDSIALHDPLAVGVALDPGLVTTIQRDVQVETRGEFTRGQTIVDLRPQSVPSKMPTRVCLEVDAARFKSLFLTTLGLVPYG